MDLRTRFLACLSILFVFVLAAGHIGFAQSTPSDDSPSTPAIAYSEMQSPVPTPAGQAAPDPIPPTQQQQPEDRPAPGRPAKPDSQAASTQPQQDAARSFTGTIVKNGDAFVLTTQDNVNFQLDDQERARNYQGKQVKVTGTVDATALKIHVQKIEPIV
ncbi:MAG TPA: DUF5818 domain-containing protein [Terriglobales bacterium]|nr:DUF5818 domain-containing protein [Terriglobales bacterium]